ncbi:hypothetical protein IIA95_01495 [Patescibacteria group bacterium]|nr:hypothetical protein [Patescibacteria group bacterium]
MTKRLGIFLILLIVLILGVHAWAVVNAGYYKIWWLDIALHFAGGFWIVAFVFWFLLYRATRLNVPSWMLLVSFVSFSVLIGVFWEFFEFSFDYFARFYDVAPAQLGLSDTLSDLLFDFLGALIASIYFLYFYTRKLPSDDIMST